MKCNSSNSISDSGQLLLCFKEKLCSVNVCVCYTDDELSIISVHNANSVSCYGEQQENNDMY